MTNWNWSMIAPLAPELMLAVVGMALLIFGAFKGEKSIGFITACVVAAFAVAAGLLFRDSDGAGSMLGGMIIGDAFSSWMKIVILGGLAISLMISYDWLKENQLVRFEYPLLVLFSGIGMLLMVSATNLMSTYVALELSSLCLYVLAAIRRDNIHSAEAGIKYFVLGAFSSGLLLFGISLVYGFVGSTDYAVIGATLSAIEGSAPIGAVVGMVFILAGLAFKVSAVPFHMWAPDVYQGAPMPVTALFAIVPKIAAMGLIIRLLMQPFHSIVADWSQVIIFMSCASMIWGAFAAIAQENIKRLLAYSSIANMGYALIGILANVSEGAASVILYIFLYMIMTAGTFAILMSLKRNGQAIEKISDLAGLSKTSPFLAYGMAAMMFSMSGIPPLAGFFSKLFIFQAAVAAGYYTVAVIGVLSSVVGTYYYLRIVKVMFFDESSEGIDKDGSALRKYVAVAMIAITVLFCASPMTVLSQAQIAASSLFP